MSIPNSYKPMLSLQQQLKSRLFQFCFFLFYLLYLFEFFFQIIEKKQVDYFMDIFDTCVMHATRAASFWV